MRVLIILGWIVSSTAWAGGIVRGKIRVIDDGPVDAFFITHTHASKMNPTPKQIISKDGSFEFGIDGPDYHWWVFAAPGYESVVLFPNVTREHDIIEFNIVLGRHQIRPNSVYSFHVKDSKPLTFVKQGNRLVHETKSAAPIVGVLYQDHWPLNVNSGGSVLNGYGGFEVRLMPNHGRYEIDFGDYPARTGMRHERIIPIKNYSFNAAVDNMMGKYSHVKAEQGRKGLLQLLDQYEKKFQGMDALHFRYVANSKLSRSLDQPLFPMDSFEKLWEYALVNDSFAVSMYYAPIGAAKYQFGELNKKSVHGYADYCRR